VPALASLWKKLRPPWSSCSGEANSRKNHHNSHLPDQLPNQKKGSGYD